jgi:serine protease Do
MCVGRLALSLLLVAGLASCKTTGSSSNPFATGQGLYGQSYSFLYSPADHVGELLKAGEVEKASAVWNDQAPFFSDRNDKEIKSANEALVSAIRASLEPRVATAMDGVNHVQWPTPRSEWPRVKAAINQAESAIETADGHKVLKSSGASIAQLDELRKAVSALSVDISRSAPAEFMALMSTESANFFDEYPSKIETKAFLLEHRREWADALKMASADKIAGFANTYKAALSDDGMGVVADLHYRTLLRANPAGNRFAAILDATTKTKSANLPLASVTDARVRVVEVTSKTLVKGGQIEFPVAIDIDLPFAAEKADLDEALSSATTRDAEILVLIDVSTARNDRRIASHDGVASEFQSGTQNEPNPDHPIAQASLTQAQLNLVSVRQQANFNSATCYGLGCILAGIANAASISSAEGKVRDAMSRLSSTPMTLTKPIYTPYKFNKASIDAAKVGTVNYYVIDKVEKSFVRGTFDIRETKSFMVAYGLHENDRNRSTHLSSTDAEKSVLQFESAPVTVPLSQILEKFRSGVRKPLPATADLRTELAAAKNKVIAAASARSYSVAPIQDKRFDSVVVVRHPGGGLGSGFYVRDDLVVTNYHVIRDANYVELHLHGGAETFGKVIARDVRLDLALIKVQARGNPVAFYTDRALAIGQSVDAIGHPKGLEFSLSRGVVSGMREIPSSFAPSGRPVRFIQTDAAINPGNSGGPLFAGEKVVGVNTQKLAMHAIEGLGFAVHYGEVLDFLEKEGVTMRPGS